MWERYQHCHVTHRYKGINKMLKYSFNTGILCCCELVCMDIQHQYLLSTMRPLGDSVLSKQQSIWERTNIVQGNIYAVLLPLLMMALAVKKHPANLYPCVPITLSLCHSNPLGCHRPERSSNGNGDRAERARAKPGAAHRHTRCRLVCQSRFFLLSILFLAWKCNTSIFVLF